MSRATLFTTAAGLLWFALTPTSGASTLPAVGGAPITGFSAGEGFVSFLVPTAQHTLVEVADGQRLDMAGADYLKEPGKPMLPERDLLVLLPPGARALSVEVEMIGSTTLPGRYRIAPTPPLVPISDSRQVAEALREWDEQRRAAYGTDEPYPPVGARVADLGGLRKYSYARVAVCPFTYRALSGELVRHAAARVRVTYRLPEPGSEEARLARALLADTVADERAAALFCDYDEMKALYEPPADSPEEDGETYDYVIVTTADIASRITGSAFVDWKISLGHNVRIVLTDGPEIAGQPGVDLAERIRNFLRASYGPWGIEYVLLVGDYASVPMRYGFPKPDDHSHNPFVYASPGASVPTDAYYADLSLPDDESWDLDGDGFHGEYGEDMPDFLPEVYVGRIPTSNPFYVAHALDKSVLFEQDDGAWKRHALHGGAILFYENQDHTGIPFRDGADCLALIENDFMAGWTVSRYCEHAGLDPSAYPWPALSESAFTAGWRSGQYGLVNWAGHGSSDGAWRVIWTWDDGDGVFETDGSDGYEFQPFVSVISDLERDYPSIVFAVSCNVGYPEPNELANLGVELVTRPGLGAAVAIASATRVASVTADWPATRGGAESFCYLFNQHLIGDGDGAGRTGNALLDAKCDCHLNYAFASYREYWNLYDYNLYGDPSLPWAGAATGVEASGTTETTPPALALRAGPSPARAATAISYRLPAETEVKLAVFDVRGRKVASLVEGVQEAGSHTVTWDGCGADGSRLPSAVYFIRLEAGELRAIRSQILLR